MYHSAIKVIKLIKKMWYIDHNSYVDGPLDSFHILPIATMNIGVHISFLIRVFIFFGYTGLYGIHWTGLYDMLDYIAGQYCYSIFNILGTSILFSSMAVPTYIPTNSVLEFPFIHILTTFILFVVFLTDPF